MVELFDFLDKVNSTLDRDVQSNINQMNIIIAPPDKSVKIVAGPGSGKTTVIVLRLLKLVFVDKIEPSEIFATTFTKKAASELKSRILQWGNKLRFALQKPNDVTFAEENSRLKRLNFDAVITGTLDSIAEETLTDYRQVNENPPIIVEEFVARQIMTDVWFSLKNDQPVIVNDLTNLHFEPFSITNLSKKIKILMDIHYRMMENGISPESIENDTPGISKLMRAYMDRLDERKLMDFPQLEHQFLRFLSSEGSSRFTDKISILMVDEYQDTNIQQEKIYLELAKKVCKSGGSITVVGDDDQSIYRFRGSRVHLFTDIEKRFQPSGINLSTEFLSVNYRSSPNIVQFCNDFVTLDNDYQAVRVKDKPEMSVSRSNSDNYPIFGIFRNTREELADEIVKLVTEYSLNGSYTFDAISGEQYIFEKGPGGSTKDVVLLMPKVSNKNSSGKDRLPAMIEQRLDADGHIHAFNPRGNELYDEHDVRLMLGTLLLCLDPEASVLGEIRVVTNVLEIILAWRQEARDFIETAEPFENASGSVLLSDIVNSWSSGTAYPKGSKWKKEEVSVLDILYNILPWIPNIRSDAEKMVYLQAVCNTISKAVLVRNHDINISFDSITHKPSNKDVKTLYNRVIIPIADGTIDLDEELFFSLSMKDRFNIMTIHQSKGLEFPIVIVDVSSDFDADRSKLNRYPNKLDSTSIVESLLSPYSDDMFSGRDYIDSQFDDLIRKFFVAFSRSQDVLILVGLNTTFRRNSPIKNIATGWDRNGNWIWSNLRNLKMLR